MPLQGGLVEASAVIQQDAIQGSVIIPSPRPSSNPVTARINDPSSLILEANKIAAQLPAQVLAKGIVGGRYQVEAIGPSSLNEFEYRERKLVDPKIAAREDYKQVKAAFDDARQAFDEALQAFDEERMADFFNARVALTQKLVDTLILIERLYGEIREDKSARSLYDKETQNHLVRFADAIRSDLAELRRMIGTTSKEAVEAINKAVYGFDDNFEVFNVKHISENASAIAMIRDKKRPSTPIGTAFLIGKNTVVTAEHCVMAYRNQEKMDDLEFVFFYEYEFDESIGAAVDREKIVCSYRESPNEKYGMDQDLGESFGVPDFAILEISPPDNKRAEIEGIKPVTLSLRRALYADALCCIGHPQGNQKKIHMNCRVLLPFELRPREINSFASILASRMAKLDKIRNRSGGNTSDRERALILKHYTRNLSDPDNADSLYYVDRTHNLQRPAIAIEADTFPGDSGAPIFDIRSNAVVGILVAGQPTSKTVIEEVSLDEHEIALPIQFVVSTMGGSEVIEAIGGSVIHKPNNP